MGLLSLVYVCMHRLLLAGETYTVVYVGLLRPEIWELQVGFSATLASPCAHNISDLIHETDSCSCCTGAVVDNNGHHTPMCRATVIDPGYQPNL